MLLDPNPKKIFKNWPKLRYDILFAGLTTKQAATKYNISKEAISQHLKKYPRIKEAYYSRPWAERQLQLAFVPDECKFTREVIDDFYSQDYPPIHRYGSEAFESALAHKLYCPACQEYERYWLKRAEAPFRLDCPPISKLIRYFEDPSKEIEVKKKTEKEGVTATEHLLICNFCRAEYYFFSKLSLNILRKLNIKEKKWYPPIGWHKILHQMEIEDIKRTTIAHPDLLNINYEELLPMTKQFIRWRIFRKKAMHYLI